MTTAVTLVTREHIERLIKYNKDHGDSTKQAVLRALRYVGDTAAPTWRIRDILYAKAISEVYKQYEEGNISLQELEGEVKHRTPDKRTIYRKLAELRREKLVDKHGGKKGGKYSLSTNAKSDMRYFASEFGKKTLDDFMKNFFPDENDIEQNISKLIKIFGTYIVYCFIEASRPISHDIASSSSLDADYLHGLVSRYLNNVFPIETMYRYFLSTIKYMFDNSQNKEQEYISTLQEANKLLDGKLVHTLANGDNKLGRHISAEEIFIAFMMMHYKREEHIKKLLQEKQYHVQQKETFHPFYELDHATVKSLDCELRKMIDTKVYGLLSLEKKIDSLDHDLRLNMMDTSRLEKLRSDIERRKPKNKAALSMIKNAQDYFMKK